MSNIQSMYKAIEFIEQHLKDRIMIADIANAVFYSLYHFCRIFNMTVHHTPYDYLICRRLSESARELVNTDKKIIEIAFNYQFNSPEAYARAFGRMFGMEPNQWKKSGKVDNRKLIPRFSLEHIKQRNKGNCYKAVLEEKIEFQISGIMSIVKNNLNDVSTIWKLFIELLHDAEKLNQQHYYGIATYPEKWEKNGYLYIAGFKIESPASMNSMLVVKKIPARKYVKFVHNGPRNDLKLTLDYIYHTWLPKSGLSLASSFEIEYYGQEFVSLDREDLTIEIFIPVI